jgi:putative addiction module killer protein
MEQEMEVVRREVRILVTQDGKCPVLTWLSELRDRRAVAAIQARFFRMHHGNFGDHRQIAGGIRELRIHFGPGYRVYFGEDGPALVLLLFAGSKASQTRDIAFARNLWKDYLRDR